MTGLGAAAAIGLAGLIGGVIGALLTLSIERLRCRVRRPITSAGGEDPAFSEIDRQQLAAEFAVHAAAVHSQVSHYADQLAGSDPVLRERLRLFEVSGTGPR